MRLITILLILERANYFIINIEKFYIGDIIKSNK